MNLTREELEFLSAWAREEWEPASTSCRSTVCN
jgi:hypothetical protein